MVEVFDMKKSKNIPSETEETFVLKLLSALCSRDSYVLARVAGTLDLEFLFSYTISNIVVTSDTLPSQAKITTLQPITSKSSSSSSSSAASAFACPPYDIKNESTVKNESTGPSLDMNKKNTDIEFQYQKDFLQIPMLGNLPILEEEEFNSRLIVNDYQETGLCFHF